MKNIEKYKDEILKYAGYQHSLMCLIYENIMKKNDCTGCCSKCKRETDEAKAYLKAILEPIEGCCNICKVPCSTTSVHELIFSNGNEYASLKYKTGTKLYKYFEGLDYSKNYSLEELNL